MNIFFKNRLIKFFSLATFRVGVFFNKPSILSRRTKIQIWEKNIIFFKLDNLGDFMIVAWCLKNIDHKLMDKKLTIFVRDQQLLKLQHVLKLGIKVEVFSLRRLLRLFMNRKNSFSISLRSYPFCHSFFCFISGKRSISFGSDGLGFFSTYLAPGGKIRNQYSIYHSLLETVFCSYKISVKKKHPTYCDYSMLKRLLKKHKNILISPQGSSFEKYIANKFLHGLRQVTNFDVLIDDKDAFVKFYGALKDFNFTQVNIEKLPKVLSNYDLVLSSDSFIAHLSHYLNKKTVVLFPNHVNPLEWSAPHNLIYKQ